MRFPGLGTAAALAVGLLLSLSPASAEADAITTWQFSGTLASNIFGGTSVTGDFTVDETAGTFLQFNFSTPLGTVSSANGSAQVFSGSATSPFVGPLVHIDFLMTDTTVFPIRRTFTVDLGLTFDSPLIAVGTLVTGRPPHRTVRAGFPHTAPTLDV